MKKPIIDEKSRQRMIDWFRDELTDERAKMAFDLLPDDEKNKLVGWEPGGWYDSAVLDDVTRAAYEYEDSLSDDDLHTAAVAWHEGFVDDSHRVDKGVLPADTVEYYGLQDLVKQRKMTLHGKWYYTPDALARRLEIEARERAEKTAADIRADVAEIKRNVARLAGERETKRERKSAAAKKAAAENRDKVHDDEIAAALAKVHKHAGDDKAKIAHWCDKVIHDDGLQVRGRGGVYKPMTRATLMRYYRKWRKTHGGT